MCEYCGCQSIPTIAELTAEHDRIVDLIGEARSANSRGDVDSMVTLCGRISDVLDAHTAVEEHGLFPVMAIEFPEQIAVLESEHRHIERVLAEAAEQAMTRDATWPDRAMETLAGLRLHILKEQDGVFPAALSTMTNDQWERLDQIRREHHMAR